MTEDQLLHEILINRIFLIVIFIAGGFMFAFIGIMAWWSVRMVQAEVTQWRQMVLILAKTIKDLQDWTPPTAP